MKEVRSSFFLQKKKGKKGGGRWWQSNIDLLYLDIDKARKAYEDAQSEVNQLSSDLDKVNEELNFDYGKEKEWLKLKDVCIEKNEGE